MFYVFTYFLYFIYNTPVSYIHIYIYVYIYIYIQSISVGVEFVSYEYPGYVVRNVVLEKKYLCDLYSFKKAKTQLYYYDPSSYADLWMHCIHNLDQFFIGNKIWIQFRMNDQTYIIIWIKIIRTFLTLAVKNKKSLQV